uniref:Uncharacterized protein n=1 Tax=Lygus hesperus TaxID=30085 RepID=A0A0K8SAK9_LYGHE
MILIFPLFLGAISAATAPHRPVDLHQCSLVKFDLNDLDNALYMYKNCTALFNKIKDPRRRLRCRRSIQKKINSAIIAAAKNRSRRMDNREVQQPGFNQEDSLSENLKTLKLILSPKEVPSEGIFRPPPRWRADLDPSSLISLDSKFVKFRSKQKHTTNHSKFRKRLHKRSASEVELQDATNLTIATIYLVLMVLSFSVSVFIAVLLILKICCLTDCLCMEFCKTKESSL